MLPRLDEVPRIRRALGLTQAQLAKRAGVSQSAVAKIERGTTSPSYEVVRRLFECLEAERAEKERVATIADVRSRRILSVSPRLSLEAAVAEMRRHQISQLPVLDGRNPVGSLSERSVTNLILAGRAPSEFARIRVSEVMEPPFPTLDERSPVALAAALLQHYAAVLATTQGQVQGIVTRSDLLKLV